MRTVLLTIGPTHAGKTTFAKKLACRLPSSLIIDQDLQARFLLEHYPDLVPTEGPNHIKHDLTGWLIEKAITSSFETIILCNANTTRTGRKQLLNQFPRSTFRSILVWFDLPEAILSNRLTYSNRDGREIRGNSSYHDIYQRQRIESPVSSEADKIVRLRSTEDVETFLEHVTNSSQDSLFDEV
ncbi:AAA family ATPase [Exiguobacterium acetylicum]|uniref:AAA family ATPase n=1 Tax=Exiguobacterium acetylicum TaxID=41170 RepID=UPI0027E0F72C|nr:AAA family ATPase [Exiguobacterium acetylicum]MDQ6466800.1 AAA family ATPase [Exiguobacterium acetylicum]